MNKKDFRIEHGILVRYIGKGGDVVIPEGVTRIEASAFADCTTIISVTIPGSVISIGECAFAYCKSLTTVTIGNGMIKIGYAAFENCSSLTTIMIPDSVTTIESFAFFNCSDLVSITIGKGVARIGVEAFYGCKKLKKTINIKATNGYMYCRDFQYSLGEWYHEDDISLCHKGFHYCTNAFDVFSYYSGRFGVDFRLFEVEAKGTSEEKRDDSKRVCTDIKLVREITSLKELFSCN